MKISKKSVFSSIKLNNITELPTAIEKFNGGQDESNPCKITINNCQLSKEKITEIINDDKYFRNLNSGSYGFCGIDEYEFTKNSISFYLTWEND